MTKYHQIMSIVSTFERSPILFRIRLPYRRTLFRILQTLSHPYPALMSLPAKTNVCSYLYVSIYQLNANQVSPVAHFHRLPERWGEIFCKILCYNWSSESINWKNGISKLLDLILARSLYWLRNGSGSTWLSKKYFPVSVGRYI